MPENRVLPRHRLAKNLRALLEKTGLSAPEVARRAGVDRKTLNNQLNGRYDPRHEQVDAVAKVFGLEGWQLIHPAFDPNRANNHKIEHLVELYTAADEQGRESIMRVAEMAATYKPK